jgi:LysR family transcriptional regulator of gallate degradation
MDLKQLERFVIAAECGNIGAASTRLGLSQPALTRSIQLLEETVGAPLFDRMARGVKLTALGSKILPYAKLMVRERLRLKNAIDEFNGISGGVISLGVPGNLEAFSADTIVNFRKKNPDSRFSVNTGVIADLLAKLHEGSIDILLCTPGRHAIPEGITFEPLFDRTIAVVARAEHPLALQSTVTLKDLSTAQWLAYGGAVTVDGVRRLFEERGLTAPVYTTWCESLSLLKTLLLKGDFVTSVDEIYLLDEIKTGEIKRLLESEKGVTMKAGILAAPGIARTPTLNAYIQVARSTAKAYALANCLPHGMNGEQVRA